MSDKISIYGARENNLKNIDLEIPKNQFIVFTGLSGSGKSTLAFDTLYAEGQRRYLESLSSYARQFLDRVGKPAVDKIEGLIPAIAIDQKSTSKNPRSTVGTITEIYDYLRLLFARVGKQHCHLCGAPIASMGVSDIITQVLQDFSGAKILILAPIIKDKKGTFADKIVHLRQKGFVRAYIDGVIVRLDEEIDLAKSKKHTIKAVVDRLEVHANDHARLASALEKALAESYGQVEIMDVHGKKSVHYSEHLACFKCKVSFEALEPLSFSFNSPKGACEACAGLGSKLSLDTQKILDPLLPLQQIKSLFYYNSYYSALFEGFCQANHIDSHARFDSLSAQQQEALLYGNGKEICFSWRQSTLKRPWKGLIQIAYDLFKDTRDLGQYMSEKTCATCQGHRLKGPSLGVQVAGLNIATLLDMPIDSVHAFFNNPANFAYLSAQNQRIATPILKEILERVFFLVDVGLGYLSLGRDARTLSGGESQRIRIASQIGSGLTGVLYVLDEPSIGLHEKDTLKLIKTLKNLQKKGNTLIVVEHDKETIRQADFVVDIGPRAGKHGGEVTFSGSVANLLKGTHSTALYLSGVKKIERPKSVLKDAPKFLELKGVYIHNIKNLRVKIPLGQFVCVTGVSGSGKSSLILQTLLPIAQECLNHAKKTKSVGSVEIGGLEHLDKVIYLDQAPIGKTPRSNPATYTGVMDEIRDLFAQSKEAKMLGYSASRFSFNVKGGRCEKCHGEGDIKIEMHFLPDVLVQCDVCKGRKYNQQTLEIKIRGKSIADVLSMSVEEALDFFGKIPKIAAKLQTLSAVGLGYITLGQNATTLSGGEAQRIKLAKELSRKDTGKTLYILDEPTTGLHFEDVQLLINVLHSLVELGNSMLVIEHNLDVIKNADHIIDMGPEGGDLGGKIVAQGTPLKLAQDHKKSGSYTGQFLALELGISH